MVKIHPHPTLSMPTDGSDIYIIIPIHIDDGLAATNSKDLYVWLIDTLNRCFSIKNLGAALMFLGIRIEQDRPTCKLWLPEAFCHGSSCNAQYAPVHKIFHSKLEKLMPLPDNALPDVADADIQLLFQSLTGSYIYLTVMT